MTVLVELKSVAVDLLIPPFGFVTMAMLTLLLPRNGFRRLLLKASVIGLLVLAVPIVANSLLDALEAHLLDPPTGSPAPKAIVVLGGDIRRTSDRQGVVVGPLSLERLASAARLQRQTGLPILISGGTLQKDTPAIAEVMAASLRDDFHVPVRWRETHSFTTWDNAFLSAEILKKEGITSVYVVTHAWHMRRALIAFRRTGLIVTPAPVPPDRGSGVIVQDFIPRVSSWMESYFALHEWIGCAWYSVR